MTLVPCRGCGRHVRAESPLCPFCDEPVPPGAAPVRPLVPPRLSRAALLAGLAAVAGCSPSRMPHEGMTSSKGNDFTIETTKTETTAAAAGSASAQPTQAPADAGGPQLAVEPDAGEPPPADKPDAGAGSAGDKILVKERKVPDKAWPPDGLEEHRRRPRCDRCPYGAPPPPAGRALV